MRLPSGLPQAVRLLGNLMGLWFTFSLVSLAIYAGTIATAGPREADRREATHTLKDCALITLTLFAGSFLGYLRCVVDLKIGKWVAPPRHEADRPT